MTSQQLRAKLAEAIAIVTECERLMEDPHRAADGWDAVQLKNRARSFMDTHRQSLAKGGAE